MWTCQGPCRRTFHPGCRAVPGSTATPLCEECLGRRWVGRACLCRVGRHASPAALLRPPAARVVRLLAPGQPANLRPPPAPHPQPRLLRLRPAGGADGQVQHGQVLPPLPLGLRGLAPAGAGRAQRQVAQVPAALLRSVRPQRRQRADGAMHALCDGLPHQVGLTKQRARRRGASASAELWTACAACAVCGASV